MRQKQKPHPRRSGDDGAPSNSKPLCSTWATRHRYKRVRIRAQVKNELQHLAISPPCHGPPLHVHDFEEFFYILTGRFLFEMDGKPFEVQVGDFVHAASGVPHIFQNITDKEAKMLLIARPGGIENYFAELAERMMTDPGNVSALNAIADRYGIVVLGPPIAARNNA